MGNEKHQTWEKIRDRYRRVGSTQADNMLQLVEHISQSPVALNLFPWTSMFDLCIAQVPPTSRIFVPFLRISPQFDGTIEFRYIDTNITSRQWSRVVESAQAIERFDKFVAQLHWIDEPTTPYSEQSGAY